MGLKEEIEKLEAQKKAAIAEQERARLAYQEQEKQKQLELQRQEQERLATERANQIFQNTINQRIIKPRLVELAEVLNNRRKSEVGARWNVITLHGKYHQSWYVDGYDGDFDSGINHYNVEGIAIARAKQRDTEVIRKGGIFTSPITRQRVYSDLIFVGFLEWRRQSPDKFKYDVAFLKALETSDSSEITIIDKDNNNDNFPDRALGNFYEFSIPKVSLETSNENLNALADPNSTLFKSFDSSVQQGLVVAVSELPEYKAP